MASPTSPPRSRRAALLGLVGWLLLCYGVSALAGLVQSDWYQTLQRPAWAPPGWVFGPVWGVLYGLMAVAAWLVWRQYGFSGARTALRLFLIQLFFNGLWTFLFFGLRAPGWAFAEIVLLWLLILLTTRAFWPKHRLAGALLVPYLAWVAFAAVLNFAIWQLNL